MSTSSPVDQASPPQLGPYGRRLRHQWLLEDGWVFLNHGSMGATPRAVLEAQQQWRERMERQPERFMAKELPQALRAAAGVLAEFVGTSGENLVFVENTTAAINAVLRSLRWKAGDEILITNHGYRGIRQAVEFVCRRSGAGMVEALVPLPRHFVKRLSASVEV